MDFPFKELLKYNTVTINICSGKYIYAMGNINSSFFQDLDEIVKNIQYLTKNQSIK